MNLTALRIYYFNGGALKDTTGGRSQSDQYIKPDDFSINIWKSLGIKEEQFIPEYTNETFLLHIYLREIAIGQERILAAMNGSANVFDLPYIAPLVTMCTQIAENPNH